MVQPFCDSAFGLRCNCRCSKVLGDLEESPVLLPLPELPGFRSIVAAGAGDASVQATLVARAAVGWGIGLGFQLGEILGHLRAALESREVTRYTEFAGRLLELLRLLLGGPDVPGPPGVVQFAERHYMLGKYLVSY